MITNFHTHTALCMHASGMPQEYYNQAVKDGCSMLGFSDHCPYPEEMPDRWSDTRMDASELEVYAQSVHAVQAHASIPVYFGFECEWDAAWRSWYEDTLLGTCGAQYLVLGAHWVTEGSRHVYVRQIQDAALLNRYINQTIQAMRSGLYAFVAHPDLFMIGWKKWDAQARACSEALIDAAAACALPIEVNGYGLIKPPVMTERGERYQYPVDEFWQLAVEKGASVICNSDAHAPEVVVKNALNARKYAERFGITPVDTPFTALQ